MGKLFIIPGNTPSSKNSKNFVTTKNGKTLLLNSKTVEKWFKDYPIKRAFIEQKESFISVISSLSKPYYIEFTFFRKRKAAFDYINAAQIILDLMQEYGWLENDDCDNVKPYFGDYKYSKDDPKCEIRILKNKPIHYLT